MRKAQFDKPVFFILALVVVALVLYVGFLGINYMIQMQKDNEIRTFWNSLDRAVNRNMNYGALETVTLSLPRSNAICFFNVEIADPSDKVCEIYLPSPPATPNTEDTFNQNLAGYDICERDEMLNYWKITNPNPEAQAENIILSSGLTHRNIRAQPNNEKYQCFEGSIIRLTIKGQGSHVTISPASP